MKSEFSQKCQDVDDRLPQFLAELQETTEVFDELVPRPSSGPVLYLSKSGAMFSNVNDDCRDFLTPLAEDEELRLGLPALRVGLKWAIMTLKTSPSTEWSIIVRWSPDSVFRKNLLCIQHGIIKGIVLGLAGPTPMLQLQGQLFELLHGPELDARYLQLPLQATSLHMPALGNTSFFPSDHPMLNHSMDVTVARHRQERGPRSCRHAPFPRSSPKRLFRIRSLADGESLWRSASLTPTSVCPGRVGSIRPDNPLPPVVN